MRGMRSEQLAWSHVGVRVIAIVSEPERAKLKDKTGLLSQELKGEKEVRVSGVSRTGAGLETRQGYVQVIKRRRRERRRGRRGGRGRGWRHVEQALVEPIIPIVRVGIIELPWVGARNGTIDQDLGSRGKRLLR